MRAKHGRLWNDMVTERTRSSSFQFQAACHGLFSELDTARLGAIVVGADIRKSSTSSSSNSSFKGLLDPALKEEKQILLN